VIHPTAIIGDPPEHREWKPGDPMHHPEIDDSAQVNALVSVDAGLHEPTRIGARTLLMKHVHIGHDASIGDDCELAPGTVIGGHVKFGDGVRVGVNACVRPFINVGDGARIGAGAVVVKDVDPGAVVVGNPARPLPAKD
jgi:acyl-[acyl carrier protein]--UDP-N-acetylglucosamine O-acyltransferase